MSEVFEHNPNEHEDPAAAATWIISLVGVLLLVATILGTTALYYKVKANEVEKEVVEQPYDSIEAMRTRQRALLAGPGRLVTRMEATGEVQALVIPIDRAMEIIVAENQR